MDAERQAVDRAVGSPGDELGEQGGAQAPTLVLVHDSHCELCRAAVGCVPDVTRLTDGPASDLRDQRHPVVPVDGRKPSARGPEEARYRSQEAQEAGPR